MGTPGADLTPLIDPAWLERMLARPEFAQRLFAVFLSDEPARVQAMGRAIAEGDMEMLRYLAHSLKGASATLGMARVSAACKELESAAREARPENCQELHARVEQEMEAVYALLREMTPKG